jgi:large subunit ribosomal protein L17
LAYIYLLGAEQVLSDKASKREEIRTKRREELQKQLEEANAGAEGDKPKE